LLDVPFRFTDPGGWTKADHTTGSSKLDGDTAAGVLVSVGALPEWLAVRVGKRAKRAVVS
jgi:hypothetical protein